MAGIWGFDPEALEKVTNFKIIKITNSKDKYRHIVKRSPILLCPNMDPIVDLYIFAKFEK